MKAIILIIFALMLNCIFVNAQDLYFSQFDKNPLILNPSNTGFFNGGNRLGVSYRTQWKNITTPYVTTSAFYDAQFLKKQPKDKIGLGLVFFNDKSGDVEMGLTQVSLSFAYSKLLTKENLFLFGFQTGYAQRSFDFYNATWDNQYDGNTYNPNSLTNETSFNLNYSYIDYAAGMGWSFRPSNNFRSSTGVALFHISSPKFRFSKDIKERLYRKIVVHHKTEIYIEKSPLSYEPAFAYIKQGVDKQILAGLMFRFTEEGNSYYSSSLPPTVFSIGAYYRSENALILAARLNYNNFEINYSYDFNISTIGKATKKQGGMELSLVYTQHSKAKKRVTRSGIPNFFE